MELRHQKMAEIVNWPITRARIVESSFREVPSGNHGTDTSVVVSLKLSYMVMNHLYECSYTQSWQRSDHSDYAAILAAGKEIDVRYSPSDPQTISLHPITPF